MWTPFALLVLVGLATSGPVWKPNTEYEFEVYARTLTALPDLRNQYVGLVTKAHLTLQVKSENEIVGKVSDVRHGQYHDDIPEVHSTVLDEEKLSYEKSPLEGKTFVVHYKNGNVHNLEVDSECTNDEANQLKALLSQLQVDMTGENLMKDKQNILPPGERPFGLFNVMEPVVTGECETLYQVSDLPSIIWPELKPKWAPNTALNTTDNLFSVKKEFNFGNCKDRKGYHFGLTGDDELRPNSNQVGGLLSDVSTSIVIAMGNPKNFTIKYATTSEEVFIRAGLDDEQKAQVLSQVQLALVNLRPVTTPVERPKNPVSVGSLVYQYNRPSDPENKLQPQHPEEEQEEEEHDENAPKIRSRRAIYPSMMKTKKDDRHRPYRPHRPSRSNDGEADEHHHDHHHEQHEQPNKQPMATLTEAPEIPLHPMFTGHKGSMIHHSDKMNVEDACFELAREIAKDVQHQCELPKKHGLDKFSMLSGLVRTMSEQQIKAVASRVQSQIKRDDKPINRPRKPEDAQHTDDDDTDEEDTVWQVYRDAVVEAGTGPAVKTLFDWVKNGQVEGEEAAQMLTALPKSIRIPTPELLREFFNFVKSDEVTRNRKVYAAAVVSFTSFLEGVEVDKKHAQNYYPSNSFKIHHEENHKLLVEEVVPYFDEKLNQAVDKTATHDVLLYIRALGNLGHPQILRPFAKQMVNDTNLTEFERVAIVFALDELVDNYPKEAQHALHLLYFNVAENPQVRCAALLQLFRSNPSANTLQYIASFTQHDPHTHVQACTKSAIESAADLKLPENSELAKNAEAARNHLTPIRFGEHYPEINFRDYWLKNLKLSRSREFSLLTSPESYYPNAVHYESEDNVQGFHSLSVEASAMLSSVDKLVKFFRNNLGEGYEPRTRLAREDHEFSSKWTRKYVDEQLNIRPYVDEDMEGQLYFKALGFERFFTYDKDTLEHPEKLLDALQNAKHVNYNKFHVNKPVEVAFPLATGHPLFFKSSMPGLLQLQGDVDVKLSDKPNELLSTVNVTAKGSFLYSSTRLAHVGFFVPSLAQQYVAGYNKKVQAHLPYNMEVHFDAKHGSVRGRISYLEPEKDVVLVQAGSYPFTARKSVDSLVPIAKAEDLKIIHSRPQKGFKFCTGKDSTGSVYCVDAQYEWKYGDLLEFYELFQRQDFGALTNWDLPIGQNDYYSMKLTHDATKSTNKGVRFALNYKHFFFANQNAPAKPSEEDDVNLSFTNHHGFDNEERRKELAEKASGDVVSARADVLDASVVFEGGNEASYGFTLVKVDSPLSPKYRLTFNAYAHPVKRENTKHLCGLGSLNTPQVSRLNFEDVLATDLQTKGHLAFVLGPSCFTAATQYAGQFELNRSEKLKKEVSTSATADHCREEMKHGRDLAPACVNATYQASFLDHAKVSVHFLNPSPQFRNLTDFVHNYLRYKHYGHFSVDPEKKGEKNLVVFESNLNQAARTANASLQTQEYREEFYELPYSPVLHGLFYLQPKVGYSRELGMADHYTCDVANTQVWTFDNATTDQHFGKCWYALAHYYEEAGNRPSPYHHNRLDAFSVLVRGEPGTDHKELLVIIPQPGAGHDHSIRLSPAPGNTVAKALINGEDHEMVEGAAVHITDDGKNPLTDKPAFIVAAYKNEIFVHLRDGLVQVYYNERGVKVLAHKSYFRDVRGLCGNYNGERYDDKLSPRNCGYRDEELLAPSWSVADNECSAEDQQLKKKSEEARCLKHYYIHSILVGDDEHDETHDDEKEERPRPDDQTGTGSDDIDIAASPRASRPCNLMKQVQYIQSGEHVCFSQQELHACPKHCIARGKTEEKVKVHCRPSTDSLAQLYRQKINKGAKIDVSQKETTKTVTFSVPRACRQA